MDQITARMPIIETRHILYRSTCWENGASRAISSERPMASVQIPGAIPPNVTALRLNGIWYLPATTLEKHLESQWSQALPATP